MTRRALALVAVAVALAGCTAMGTSARNFTLEPLAVGWYAGDEAAFSLGVEEAFLSSAPTYVLDRRFAIEEIRLEERAPTFGGDFSTREPDDVGLLLVRGGIASEAYPMDLANSTVEIRLRLPAELRDSQYQLELKLFEVGWIKSGVFRVDVR